MWQMSTIQPLNKSSIELLIENKIPGVHIERFADKQQIEKLKYELDARALRTSSIAEVTRLGISQYQQGICESKENYFELARKLNEEFQTIFSNSFSPVQKIINHFVRLGIDAAIMEEPGFGRYFAGTGKLRNGSSPIHVDYSPQDSLGWAIADARVQLAWNLYLNVPEEGGDLLIWDKQWHVEDDIHQVENNYYYNEKIVEGKDPLIVKVKEGDVVILNSRNYHAVSYVENRLAFGSFISVFDDKSMGLWS